MENPTFEIDFGYALYVVINDLCDARELSSFERVVDVTTDRLLDVCWNSRDELRVKCSEVLVSLMDEGKVYQIRTGLAWDDGGAAAEEECHP